MIMTLLSAIGDHFGKCCIALGVLCVVLSPSSAFGENWPCYRGPAHNGISTEKISKAWKEAEPRILWKAPLTDGLSSFAVAEGIACTLIRRDANGSSQEVCVALDAASGNELWATPVGLAKYDGGGDSGTKENRGGDGPRSTPSIEDGRVYVNTAYLVLHCLDAKTGKILWTKDLAKEFGGKLIPWQNAASPLIEGEFIYVNANGSDQCLVALKKKDGAIAWKGQNDKMTHATPIATTIQGMRQVIFFAQSGLVSVEPSTGGVLWRYPFEYKVSTAASPVVAGDWVYCSAGYDVGAGLVRIAREGDKMTAKQVWRKPKELPNHWSTPVYYQGHLYGMFSFKEFGSGPLKCVELESGVIKWSQNGFGPGNVILADGHLLALDDQGTLVLVAATPSAYQEVGRLKAIEGKCWSTPALSNGRLYVRSTKEGACIDLSPK